MTPLIPFMDDNLKRINWKNVSSISAFPNDYFALHPDLPWDLEQLCQNPSVDAANLMRVARILEEEKKHGGDRNVCNDCFEKLSANPSLHLHDVISNPHLSWNWRSISSRGDLHLHTVICNLECPWNWNMISANKNITWDMVVDNPDLPWCWFWLSDNPNITREVIEENIDRPWDFSFLSWNPRVTYDTVCKSEDKPWDWDILSKNPGFMNSLLKELHRPR